MLRVVIQTVRLGAYGLILTGLAFAAHGEGMRLLETLLALMHTPQGDAKMSARRADSAAGSILP